MPWFRVTLKTGDVNYVKGESRKDILAMHPAKWIRKNDPNSCVEVSELPFDEKEIYINGDERLKFTDRMYENIMKELNYFCPTPVIVVDINDYIRNTFDTKYYLVDESNFAIHLTEIDKDTALLNLGLYISKLNKLTPEKAMKFTKLEDRIKGLKMRRN